MKMTAEHEEVTIASAVVLPSTGSPDRSTTKRRTSTGSPEVSKRPRLSSSGDLTAGADNTAADDDEKRRVERRKRMEEQERQRGQRLFGALLGTIGKFQQDSQSARAKAGANRRKEVEEKLQQKLKQQTEELDEKKRKESDILMVKKRTEYKAFEARSLRLRHENLRDRSNFLRTKTHPPLYYLPWKLTEDDEDRIRAQKEEVEITIERESAEFEEKRRREAYEEERREDLEHQRLPPANDDELDNGADSKGGDATNHDDENTEIEQRARLARADDADDQDGDTTMHGDEDDKAPSPDPQAAEDPVNPSNDASITNIDDDENQEATATANIEED